MVRAACRPLAATVVLVIAGCGGGSSSRHAAVDRATPTAGAASLLAAANPCRPAPVRHRDAPAWTRVSQVPPMPFPYALARGEPVAAFLFSHPLRARLPRGTRNKILWVVGTHPKAAPLRITGRTPAGVGRVGHWRGDAGFGSGQVQRSLLQFPVSGCWRLTLRWGSHKAQLDVHVRPRRR